MLKNEVRRFFYPIGQGAFYAERHEGFNMIFDCGCQYPSKKSKSVVSQNYSKSDIIDILFISHLDWDHISLIESLCNCVNGIKKVVMPLISPEQKNILINLDRIESNKLHNFIQSPEDFFNRYNFDTSIIYVSTERDEGSEGDERRISLDQLRSNEIISGKMYYAAGMIEQWFFIPYNFKSEERMAALQEAITKSGFDFESLKSDPEYTLNIIKDRKLKNKLKGVYHSLDGNINENSLVLYSGPIKNEIYIGNEFYDVFSWTRRYHGYYGVKPACVYTGDSDLNKNKISEIYGDFWSCVGVVQVPHHGSIHSYDFNSPIVGPIFYPVSFGINNTYGHPSEKVISEIESNGGTVIYVTEKQDSVFFQRIISY